MANTYLPYTDTPLSSPGLAPPSPLHSQLSFAESKELLPEESVPYIPPRSSKRKYIVVAVILVILAAISAGVGAAVSKGNKKAAGDDTNDQGVTDGSPDASSTPGTTDDAPARITMTFEYGRDVMRGVNLGTSPSSFALS